jgi:uncharacterized protein
VKVGDVVKVKVLEVDVARKRIALTRRLDDVPGEARGGKREERPAANERGRDERGGRDSRGARDGGGGRDGRGEPRGGGRGGSGGAAGAAPANTAMADALRALKR